IRKTILPFERTKRATGDGCRRIPEERTFEPGVGIRSVFDGGPTEIAPSSPFVNFLSHSPHIIDPDAAALRIDSKRERIAQSQAPNAAVLAASLIVKGIVLGNATAGFDAKDLAQQRLERL